MITHWFPRGTKTGNIYRNSHWSVRYNDVKLWREEFVCSKIKGKFNRVHFVVFRPRELDKDNFYQGLKPIIDAMKHCGLIEDDRPSKCHITTTQIWGVKPYGVMVGMTKKEKK